MRLSRHLANHKLGITSGIVLCALCLFFLMNYTIQWLNGSGTTSTEPIVPSGLVTMRRPDTVEKSSAEQITGVMETSAALTAYQLAGDLDNRASVLVQVHDVTLATELVNRPESITLGLSGRQSIGSDGMLFALPAPKRIPTFWMKDMQFPIDIVWIDSAGEPTVVGVSPQLPAPRSGTVTSQLPTYSPNKPADLVLELPAGRAAELGLVEGTTVHFFSP